MVSTSNSSPLLPKAKSVYIGRARSVGFCSSRSMNVRLNQKQHLFGSPCALKIPREMTSSVAEIKMARITVERGTTIH